VNILIEKLRDEIIQIVDRIDQRIEENEEIRSEPPENMSDLLSGDHYYVYSQENGFIQHMYEIKLANLAEEKGIIIRAEKMIGDYVTNNSKLFSIWPQTKDGDKDIAHNNETISDSNKKHTDPIDSLEQNDNEESIQQVDEPVYSSERDKSYNNENAEEDINIYREEDDIRHKDLEIEEIDDNEFLKYVVIDNERSKKNDIEFGLLKLTEVALKAISPGINDPNTAIFCINQLGWVMSRIAVSSIENTYHFNGEGILRLIIEDITFGELLYKTFFQICHYGSQDVSVAGSILDALLIIAEGSSEEIKDQVWDFSNYVLGSFDKGVLQKEDKRFLNHKLARLARETDKRKDYEYFQLN
ncbi:MAG: DUF2254 family protein, partial [Halanaerobiales bacterium]